MLPRDTCRLRPTEASSRRLAAGRRGHGRDGVSRALSTTLDRLGRLVWNLRLGLAPMEEGALAVGMGSRPWTPGMPVERW